MKTAKPNRFVKNKVGGVYFNVVVALAIMAIAFIVGITLFSLSVGSKQNRGDEAGTATIEQEIQWLKTRVANLEEYTGYLEAQIQGLEFFDVVFNGGDAETNRANYDRAVNQAFERIANGRGVALE